MVAQHSAGGRAHTVPTSAGHPRHAGILLVLPGALGTLLPAAATAAFWTVALWDRTSLAGLSSRWAITWLVLTVAIAGWAVWTARASLARALAAGGLLPAATLSLAALALVYLSDDAHHAFVYRPWLKGLLVPATLVLVAAAPAIAAAWPWPRERKPRAALAGTGVASGGAWPWPPLAIAEHLGTGQVERARALLAHHAPAVATLTLVATGVAQAAAFCAVTTDDLIRYWAIADGLRTGAGYPVTTGTTGGGFYLVELPVYPLLILASTTVLGHRYVAVIAPLLAAAALLPLLLYAVARAAGASRLRAAAVALLVSCLPYYRVYATGAAQPEALLAAELALLLWLAMRCMAPAGRLAAHEPAARTAWWIALGLVAALAALTRPEGALYVAALFAGLAWLERRALLDWLRAPAQRPLPRCLVAASASALPIMAFSAFLLTHFGVLWPAGWANVAGAQFLAANVRLVLRQDLPHYAAVAGLPEPRMAGLWLAAVGVAIAITGLARLWWARPALRFIPFALAVNLAVIFASPTYLTLDLFSPPTFFRHLSVLFPWLVPAATLALPSAPPGWTGKLGRVYRPALLAGCAAALLAELAVLGTSTARDQAQVPTVLTADPYVLVTDLWQAHDTLPVLPFTRQGGVTAVDPSFDYLAMRRRLFDAVRPYDLHFNDAGRAYVLATAVFALVGLAALALAAWRQERAAGGVLGRPEPAEQAPQIPQGEKES